MKRQGNFHIAYDSIQIMTISAEGGCADKNQSRRRRGEGYRRRCIVKIKCNRRRHAMKISLVGEAAEWK
jgi:hypothetical protein